MSYHYWGISICYCGSNVQYLDILHLGILLAVFCRCSCHSFNPSPYIIYQDTSLFAVWAGMCMGRVRDRKRYQCIWQEVHSHLCS